MKQTKRILAILAIILCAFLLFDWHRSNAPKPVQTAAPVVAPTSAPEQTTAPVEAPVNQPEQKPEAPVVVAGQPEIKEDGIYDTKDEVALYIHTYGKLPSNYMTKKEARKQGWRGGALNRKIKGMCIGGDEFSNFEGTLPEKEGRIYYECDIDTIKKKKRGAKRIVFSNDGLVYYTEDHYETFELLYGEES